MPKRARHTYRAGGTSGGGAAASEGASEGTGKEKDKDDDKALSLVEKRLKQNREAARRSRERKRHLKEELRRRMPVLQKQHDEMAAEVDELMKSMWVRGRAPWSRVTAPAATGRFLCASHGTSRACAACSRPGGTPSEGGRLCSESDGQWAAVPGICSAAVSHGGGVLCRSCDAVRQEGVWVICDACRTGRLCIAVAVILCRCWHARILCATRAWVLWPLGSCLGHAAAVAVQPGTLRGADPGGGRPLHGTANEQRPTCPIIHGVSSF